MLYENQIINNTYIVIREIGSGGMGVVYLAYHLRLEKYIVLKKIKGKNLDYSLIRNEVDILKTLHHPYLPQVYDFIHYNSELYTVIDYISGYDLKWYIDNGYVFSESQLIKWLAQMCEVLSYLHSQTPPVLHTDIKPANIIITEDGNICLIDFGISLNNNYDVKGLSENYSSPEQYYNVNCVLQGDRGKCIKLTAQTDIYSTGATFYHLMTGIVPSVVNEMPQLSDFNTNYSEAFISIVEKAFERDLNHRFKNVDEMHRALLNMRKLDSRYKKYVIVQLAAITISLSIIISGIFMTYFGHKNQIISNYESLYGQFYDYYQKGDYDNAIKKGNEILNNSDYKSTIDSNSLASLMHGIGESCYNISDYTNAEYYFKNAIEICDNADNKEDYYEGYILSKVKNNEFDSAEQILNEMQQAFPDTKFGNIINAYISFYQNKYEEAINLSNVCIDNTDDGEDLFLAYIIKGESYEKLSDYSNAVEAYKTAIQYKDDVFAMRKYGNMCLVKSSNDNYSDTNLIREAKDTFEKIYNNYYYTIDDVINLAQCYRLLNEDSICLKFLSEYVNDNEVNDFRVYMHMAITADKLNDPNTKSYCEKAKDLYNKMDKNSRLNVSSTDLNIMKNLYSRHCGSSW